MYRNKSIDLWTYCCIEPNFFIIYLKDNLHYVIIKFHIKNNHDFYTMLIKYVQINIGVSFFIHFYFGPN